MYAYYTDENIALLQFREFYWIYFYNVGDNNGLLYIS